MLNEQRHVDCTIISLSHTSFSTSATPPMTVVMLGIGAYVTVLNSPVLE